MNNTQENRVVMQTQVFHGEQAWFVSTIDRESSAWGGGRYYETLVWAMNPSTRVRGSLLFQVDGGIAGHLDCARQLEASGVYIDPADAE